MKLSQYHKAFYKELFEVPIDKYWGKCIFCWVPAFLLRHFRFRLSGRISKRIRRKLNGRQMCMYTESFLTKYKTFKAIRIALFIKEKLFFYILDLSFFQKQNLFRYNFSMSQLYNYSNRIYTFFYSLLHYFKQ